MTAVTPMPLGRWRSVRALPTIGKLLGHRKISTTAQVCAPDARRGEGGRPVWATALAPTSDHGLPRPPDEERLQLQLEMAMLQHRTLSNRAVEKLTVEKDTVFWDRELTGFGVRVYPSGGKVYVAQARGPEGPKRVTIGRHGCAWRRAGSAARGAHHREGEGWANLRCPNRWRRSGPRDRRWASLPSGFSKSMQRVRYKPGTLAWTRTVVCRYIVPEFGKLALTVVERTQVRELHHRLSHAPSIANMVVRTLSLMYRLAEDWGSGAGGLQSLPLGGEVPAAQARAVPDRRGVHQAGSGTGRSRDRGRCVTGRGLPRFASSC